MAASRKTRASPAALLRSAVESVESTSGDLDMLSASSKQLIEVRLRTNRLSALAEWLSLQRVHLLMASLSCLAASEFKLFTIVVAPPPQCRLRQHRRSGTYGTPRPLLLLGSNRVPIGSPSLLVNRSRWRFRWVWRF
jgi:hypothetical protein